MGAGLRGGAYVGVSCLSVCACCVAAACVCCVVVVGGWCLCVEWSCGYGVWMFSVVVCAVCCVLWCVKWRVRWCVPCARCVWCLSVHGV